MFACALLKMVQKIERTLKDYCRLLSAQGGRWGLAQNKNDEEPF
jgi:hypothetical protein